MKKIFLSSMMVLSILLSATSCDSDNNDREHAISPAQLPELATTFVTTHFPDATYRHVKKQVKPDHDGSLYDVTLSNNFEIEFDAQGEWIDIEGNYQPIPAELIPEKIINYLATNYPHQSVTSIDYERTHIEIEITNRLELLFNLEGNFIGIDK